MKKVKIGKLRKMKLEEAIQAVWNHELDVDAVVALFQQREVAAPYPPQQALLEEMGIERGRVTLLEPLEEQCREDYCPVDAVVLDSEDNVYEVEAQMARDFLLESRKKYWKRPD